MKQIKQFDSAAAYLPYELRKAALTLPEDVRVRCEEIRLRLGRYPTVLDLGKEKIFSGKIVTMQDIDATLQASTRASPQSIREAVRWGYLPLTGGHRLGMCGTAIIENGDITGYRKITSIALRISREIQGVAQKLIDDLYPNGIIEDTLIIAPPGAGKTTFLRDLIRCVSNGIGIASHRVSLIDERCEVAGTYDLGGSTDVLENCPKAQGAMTMLRGMNPQVLALDELSASGDRSVLEQCASCGVKVIASIHGDNAVESLRKLSGSTVFQKMVIIKNSNGQRVYKVEAVKNDN